MLRKYYSFIVFIFISLSIAEDTTCDGGVSTTLIGDLEIKRIINGLWQTSFHKAPKFQDMLGDMQNYVQAGLTTWDGADIYGPAEDLMGAALNQGLGGQYFTKWVPRPGEMTEAVARAAIEQSLGKMKTSSLDLVQFHWWDYSNREYMNAMKHLKTMKGEGLIGEIGLTNFDTIRLKEMLDASIPIVSNQVSYSLLDWRPETNMVPLCLER